MENEILEEDMTSVNSTWALKKRKIKRKMANAEVIRIIGEMTRGKEVKNMFNSYNYIIPLKNGFYCWSVVVNRPLLKYLCGNAGNLIKR